MFGNWNFSFMGVSLRTWTLVLLLSELGIIFLFLPGPWMKKVYVDERHEMESQMGEGTRNRVEQWSSNWFQQYVVDTGVLRGSYNLSKRNPNEPFDDRGLGKLFADRLDVFWVAVRQILFRIAVVLLWLPCASLMFPAILFDGLMQRQILKYRSGASSPMIYHSAEVVIALLFMSILVLPMLPAPIMVPIAVPLGMALMGAALWGGLVRTAKRL